MQRYDTVAITATKTKEGFIRDAPIIGRTGILQYQKEDGTNRFEYRPPEEAFNADSLASLKGKPITIGHKGFVDAKNAAEIKPVGTVLSEGQQDGDSIRAEIVIYNLDTTARELSCGYTLDLEETAGTTPNGEHYDAIQRNIRYNHVAVVPKGRAGVARLNLDGEQEINGEGEKIMTEKMTKIKLDGGLEYDAAPEVAVYVDKLREDTATLNQKISELNTDNDKLQAKYDAALADNEKIKSEGEKKLAELKANFDSAVKNRVELLNVATKHKVEKADSLSDKEIKIAVIKSVRGDKINLDVKSDEYIDAAFDLSKEEIQTHEDALANQRQQLKNSSSDKNDSDDDSPENALNKLIDYESKLYEQEG